MKSYTVTRRAPAGQNYGSRVGQWVRESGADTVTAMTDATAQRPFGLIRSAENKVAGLVEVVIHGEFWGALAEEAVITPGTHTWVTSGANSKTKAAAANDYVGGRLISRQAVDNTGTVRDLGVFVEPQLNVMA